MEWVRTKVHIYLDLDTRGSVSGSEYRVFERHLQGH
jgi:hypothetical protein